MKLSRPWYKQVVSGFLWAIAIVLIVPIVALVAFIIYQSLLPHTAIQIFTFLAYVAGFVVAAVSSIVAVMLIAIWANS